MHIYTSQIRNYKIYTTKLIKLKKSRKLQSYKLAFFIPSVHRPKATLILLQCTTGPHNLSHHIHLSASLHFHFLPAPIGTPRRHGKLHVQQVALAECAWAKCVSACASSRRRWHQNSRTLSLPQNSIHTKGGQQPAARPTHAVFLRTRESSRSFLRRRAALTLRRDI